jgi:hypothetical protein
VTKKVIVHKFKLADVEDPEIYAAQPIYNWQQTEQGRWIMEHSDPAPVWHLYTDHATYGYQVSIVAQLNEVDNTYYQLKYGHTSH